MCEKDRKRQAVSAYRLPQRETNETRPAVEPGSCQHEDAADDNICRGK
jgi:hypothetical protein